MNEPSNWTVRVEPMHMMLPPPPGKDHGPALCGSREGHVVLFWKNVTCPGCAAMGQAQLASRAPVPPATDAEVVR